jgi:hypothetical protein
VATVAAATALVAAVTFAASLIQVSIPDSRTTGWNGVKVSMGTLVARRYLGAAATPGPRIPDCTSLLCPHRLSRATAGTVGDEYWTPASRGHDTNGDFLDDEVRRSASIAERPRRNAKPPPPKQLKRSVSYPLPRQPPRLPDCGRETG